MLSNKNNIKEALKGDKASSAFMTTMIILVVLAANVLIYVLTSSFGLVISAVENDDLSLSGSTDTLFEEAIREGKKVKISFCIAEDRIKQHEMGIFVYTTVKYFEERYPDLIEIDYINIFTKRNQNNEFVDLSKYEKDMQGNETKIYSTSVIFECEERYRVVTDTYTTAGYAPFFTLNSEGEADTYNGEEVVAGMMNWVLSEDLKNAYFTQYHGEMVDVAFTNLLSCAGYYVDFIDLRKNEVPEDCDLLIISNPTTDFERGFEGSGVRSEIERIDTYLSRGGNIYVSLDPNVKKLNVLENFLLEEGLAFSRTKIDGYEYTNMVKDPKNAITTDGFTLVLGYADNDVSRKIYDRVSKYGSGSVIVTDVAALSLSKNAQPLLMSSSSAVCQANGGTVETRDGIDGRLCVGAVSTRQNEDGTVGKIFLVPSMFLTQSQSLVTNGYSNKDFTYSLLEDFYGAGRMPYGCNTIKSDKTTLENLTMGTAKIYTVLFMSVPVIIAAVGVAVVVRRKNR